MAAPMVQVNVRVEPLLYAAIKRQAQKDKLTVSAVVTAALTNHVRRTERGETTK
jgi:hypothetical protein